MKYFANELGYGDKSEFWGIVGLLHDLDFEQFPEEHCIILLRVKLRTFLRTIVFGILIHTHSEIHI